MVDRSPAPYSPTQKYEFLANTILESLLDSEKIVPHISREDKRPNIDGEIVIVNEKRAQLCKVEVQVKKLPDTSLKKPRIPCPISLFEYSKISLQPLIFIGVDTKNKTAYWIQINEYLYAKLSDKIKKKQKKITIHFPIENRIDKSNKKYVDYWQEICQNQIGKLKNYDNIERQYALLKEHSNPILDVSRHEFGEIHAFLDNINQVLETKFPLVKRIYFSSAWKIGIAYFEYTDSHLVYSLYPIPFDKNDVQIKVIDDHLKKKLKAEHLDISGHYQENPIKTRQQNYTLEVIESMILQILKYRLLDQKNEFLAREYIFAFIDKFSIQLGLEIKNNYTIEEIDTAFFRYLPHWTNEAVQHLTLGKGKNKIDSSHYVFRKSFFDPELIFHFIRFDEETSIDKLVRTQLDNNNPVPRIPMGNEKFPFGAFFELFSFMKSLGVTNIQRIYSPKDYKRGSGWIWDVYSPEQVRENLSIFCANLNNIYTCLVDRNFPEIKNDLSIFGSANRIIVVYNGVKEHYDSHHGPWIEFYYLVDESLHKIVIELYNRDEVQDLPLFHQLANNGNFSIQGKKYEIIGISSSVLDFIYKDMPVMDYCYMLLEDNLKNYFKKLK